MFYGHFKIIETNVVKDGNMVLTMMLPNSLRTNTKLTVQSIEKESKRMKQEERIPFI